MGDTNHDDDGVDTSVDTDGVDTDVDETEDESDTSENTDDNDADDSSDDSDEDTSDDDGEGNSDDTESSDTADDDDSDDDDSDDDDVDEDEEPPLRKPSKGASNAEWAAYRKQQAARKKSGDSSNTDDDTDDEDNSGDDDESEVAKEVAKQLAPFKKQAQEQEVDAEIATFLDKNPDFKPYAGKVRKWAMHPNRSGVPVKSIFYEVAGDKLMKIGADRAKAADKKANKTKGSGGQNGGNDKGSTSYKDMPLKDFGNELQNAKLRR